jgi:hypothetical protein
MSGKNDLRYPSSPPLMPQVSLYCLYLHPISYKWNHTCFVQRSYGADRRRSLSPGPPLVPYPAYDRYIPPRSNNPYREPFPSSYRPDSWHSERQYVEQPPSPDRYRPPRHPDGDGWARSTWRVMPPPTWEETRPSPPGSFDPGWGRPRRDIMAQPMFEPSEQWKQSHGAGSSSQERYAEGRIFVGYAINLPASAAGTARTINILL